MLCVACPLGDLLDPEAPLRGAIEVAHKLAGVDQVAADDLDEADVRNLARDGGRRRLVEAPHALLDLTGRDEREPFQRTADELGLHDAPSLRHLCGLSRETASGCRVALMQREGGAQVGEYSVLFRRPGNLLEQMAGPLEPAAGLCRPSKQESVEDKLDCEPGRGPSVIEASGQPVPALVRVQSDGHVELEPGRQAEAHERLRCLALGDGRFEVRLSLAPGAPPQSGEARLERIRVWALGRLRHAERVRLSRRMVERGRARLERGPPIR